MLKLHVPKGEHYDESTKTFMYVPSTELRLQHSLKAMSAWESKWKKPFLSSEERSLDDYRSYILDMDVTGIIDEDVILSLDEATMTTIVEYIYDDRTATKIYDTRNKATNVKKDSCITTEEIYFMMVSYDIPFICEEWHYSRLQKLLEIASMKNDDSKMTEGEVLKNNRELNAQRLKEMNTKG